MSQVKLQKALCGAVSVYTVPPGYSADVMRSREYPRKTYLELQKREENNSIIEELVEVDYPITPDYVKSFVEETDYKKNPDNLLTNAGKTNLGDVTELQRLQSMDMIALQDEIKALQVKINELSTAQNQTAPTASVSVQAQSEVNNG